MSVAELEAVEIQLEASTGGLWSDAWYRLIRNPGAILGAFFLFLFFFAAIFAPVIAPYGPKEGNLLLVATGKPPGPSWHHLFGVDLLGRDVFSHIMPNSISPVIVAGTLAMGTAIIDVAGLTFLGLGPQDPATPEWGTMLTQANDYLELAPFLAIFPAIAIIISVLGFNLIGDGLREALDPKLRGRT